MGVTSQKPVHPSLQSMNYSAGRNTSHLLKHLMRATRTLASASEGQKYPHMPNQLPHSRKSTSAHLNLTVAEKELLPSVIKLKRIQKHPEWSHLSIVDRDHKNPHPQVTTTDGVIIDT